MFKVPESFTCAYFLWFTSGIYWNAVDMQS